MPGIAHPRVRRLYMPFRLLSALSFVLFWHSHSGKRSLRSFEELTFQGEQKMVISVTGGVTDGRTDKNDDAIAG